MKAARPGHATPAHPLEKQARRQPSPLPEALLSGTSLAFHLLLLASAPINANKTSATNRIDTHKRFYY